MVSLNGLLASLAVGVIAVGAAAPAWAQSSRVGVVTTLDGTATLSRVALPQGIPLKIRDDVFVADRIVTGDKSFARVLLGGKAIVTVRERSVLTITEAPGTSTVDVSIGRVAVAVVKERMKPGESVEIRTPNAVAGIRGTVVVAEVNQATSQLGATSGGFTTTITVLKGRIEFRTLDRLTRQPTGPGVAVGALQSIRVTGFAAPRPVQGVPGDVQQRLINDFRVPLRSAAATTNSAMVEGQIRQAVSAAAAQLGALTTTTSTPPAPATRESNQGSDGNEGSSTGNSEALGTAAGAPAGKASPVTGASEVNGGAPAGAAPVAAVPAPPTAPPLTGGGTTSAGNVTATAPVAAVPTPAPVVSVPKPAPVVSVPTPAPVVSVPMSRPVVSVPTPAPVVTVPKPSPPPAVAAPPALAAPSVR